MAKSKKSSSRYSERRRRKNPRRRAGALKGWRTRRARHGPSGLKGRGRKHPARGGHKRNCRCVVCMNRRRKGARKRSRKVSPASIAALKRYNENRRSRKAGARSTLEGGGTSYLQMLRRRLSATQAFSGEAAQRAAEREAAEASRWN